MELLSSKQIRMLELLDKQIQSCTDCTLYNNGRTKPYWTPMSRIMAVGEAPGKTEVEQNEPFVGKAGEILGSVMHDNGFRKEEFLIINSVNCRPIKAGGGNGKPSGIQIQCCRKWIRKYLLILNPEKIIALGQYATQVMGSYSGYGIVSKNATIHRITHFDSKRIDPNREAGINVVNSIHPAYCIYKGDTSLLEKSIEVLYYTGG
jgi:uracil-DNA glycosylase family 4